MRQITVEPSLSKALDEIIGQAVLCDDTGRALRFFSPLPGKVQVGDLQLEPPLSIAETEELRKVRTGKPLDEILSRLAH